MSRLRGRRESRSLAVLALGAFTVGTSELAVVGILGPIADDVGVSVSAAGTLVSAYALGVAVGGPVLTALTARIDRRTLLRVALAGYVAGNLLTAVAATLGSLLVSRLAAGSLHGAFIGVASVVAAGLAGPGREGRAISVVFGGVALSTVIGVPLGTLAGQALGWRATFAGIVGLGIVALVLTLAVVPPVAARGNGRTREQAREALSRPVLATLAVGFLLIGGQFAALTYLEPFLDEVTHVSSGGISAFLLAYGAATAVATFAGGRAADRSPTTTLIVADAAVALLPAALYVVGAIPGAVVVVLIAWGLMGFGLVSTSLQVRVISLAGRGGDAAASLGVSAANAGIAMGALAGGQVVAHVGVRSVVLAGAVVCLIALPAAIRLRSAQPVADGAMSTALAPAGPGT